MELPYRPSNWWLSFMGIPWVHSPVRTLLINRDCFGNLWVIIPIDFYLFAIC